MLERMGYAIDEARWPLVVARATEYLSDLVATEASYRKLESILQREQRFMLVFDLRGASSTPARRHKFREWCQRYEDPLSRLLVAAAILAASSIERGFVLALDPHTALADARVCRTERSRSVAARELCPPHDFQERIARRPPGKLDSSTAPARKRYPKAETMRPRDFLDVLENPQLPRCEVGGEQAELLRTLLVHVFFADLEFDKRELSLLKRVLPDVSTREYVKTAASRRLDLDRLAELFPDVADRDDIVRLVEHASWSDEKVERREASLLQRLVEKLGLARD
jgi:hypothetical protein